MSGVEIMLEEKNHKKTLQTFDPRTKENVPSRRSVITEVQQNQEQSKQTMERKSTY